MPTAPYDEIADWYETVFLARQRRRAPAGGLRRRPRHRPRRRRAAGRGDRAVPGDRLRHRRVRGAAPRGSGGAPTASTSPAGCSATRGAACPSCRGRRPAALPVGGVRRGDDGHGAHGPPRLRAGPGRGPPGAPARGPVRARRRAPVLLRRLRRPDGPRRGRIRPGYLDGSWTTESWTDQGVRDKVGATTSHSASSSTPRWTRLQARGVSEGGGPRRSPCRSEHRSGPRRARRRRRKAVTAVVSPVVRVRLLGTIEVETERGPSTVGGLKVQALLAMLARPYLATSRTTDCSSSCGTTPGWPIRSTPCRPRSSCCGSCSVVTSSCGTRRGIDWRWRPTTSTSTGSRGSSHAGRGCRPRGVTTGGRLTLFEQAVAPGTAATRWLRSRRTSRSPRPPPPTSTQVLILTAHAGTSTADLASAITRMSSPAARS